MPRYEYRCPANGRTIEVSHSMSLRPGTWGELCTLAGLDVGDTPASTPIEKVLSLGYVMGSKGAGGKPSHPCGPSCGCFSNN